MRALARRVRLLAGPARLAARRAARALDLHLDARPRAHLARAAGRRQASPGRPPPSPARSPSAIDTARAAARGDARRSLRPVARRAARSPPSLVVASRLLHRRAPGARARRAGSCGSAATTSPTPTASRRPSRASPARSAARWYERLWRGCDHFALEIHRLPDLSIRFTLAAPARARRRDRGPLEDLYPDVELIEVDGQPDLGATRRAAQEAPPVRAVDPDDAQLRARLHRVARRAARRRTTHETTVQLVLTPAPGVRAPPRATAAQAPRARAPARRPPRPRRARHRLRRRSQGAQGRARDSSTARCCYFDLRVTGSDRDDGPPRRRPLLAAALRERARRRADARCAGGSTPRRIELALPNPLPGLRTGVLSTSELATLWQLPRARVKHARLPRATVRRAIAPPEIERDAGARAAARRARPRLDRARRSQVRPRADRRPGRRQELGHGPPLRQRRPRRRARRDPDRPQGAARRALPRARPRRAAPCTTSTSATPRSASTR